MKKENKEQTVATTLTLKETTHNYVVNTSQLPEENRSFSNMTEILILEAKEARDKKKRK